MTSGFSAPLRTASLNSEFTGSYKKVLIKNRLRAIEAENP